MCDGCALVKELWGTVRGQCAGYNLATWVLGVDRRHDSGEGVQRGTGGCRFCAKVREVKVDRTSCRQT